MDRGIEAVVVASLDGCGLTGPVLFGASAVGGGLRRRAVTLEGSRWIDQHGETC